MQPDVILIGDDRPAGIRGFWGILAGKAQDALIEAMVRQAELGMAERIARAIRESAPEHGPCTDRPHCWKCGQESGMREAAKTALRIGAGR